MALMMAEHLAPMVAEHLAPVMALQFAPMMARALGSSRTLQYRSALGSDEDGSTLGSDDCAAVAPR